jgi:hypothetical protein
MKRQSLGDAIKPFDRTPAPVAVPKRQPEPRPSSTPSRVGKKALITYHDPAVSKQLHQMRLDLDRASIQSLVEEALDELFKKYKRPAIAGKQGRVIA